MIYRMEGTGSDSSINNLRRETLNENTLMSQADNKCQVKRRVSWKR
jgi:hypothetical protein